MIYRLRVIDKSIAFEKFLSQIIIILLVLCFEKLEVKVIGEDRQKHKRLTLEIEVKSMQHVMHS